MVNLEGIGLKERGIGEFEGLARLTDKFITHRRLFSDTQSVIPEVARVLEEDAQKIREKLLKQYTDLSIAASFESDKKVYDEARLAIVAEYFKSHLNFHWDVLSPELFQLERTERFPVNSNRGNFITASIPLFCSAGWGETGVLEKKYNLPPPAERPWEKNTLEVETSIPPVSKSAKEQARKFYAECARIYASGLEHPILGQGLLGLEAEWKREDGDLTCIEPENYTNPHLFNLGLFWIPKSEELHLRANIIDKDPLLIGFVHKTPYLVAQWDVHGEEPYQHYLKEYTESKAKE
jgi:hypothetical protein